MIDACAWVEEFSRRQRDPGGEFPLLQYSTAWRHSAGTGVVLGLLDAACDPRLRDIAGANLETTSIAIIPRRRSTTHEHATHAVHTLVGQGHDIIRGLVPKARLLVADVFGETAVAEPARVARGLDWLLAEGAQIVVLPLGGSSDHPEIARALEVGHGAGIVFFAASGNDYPNPLAFPARHPVAIAVGCSTLRGRLLPDCNRSPRLDLIAPGAKIPAPVSRRLVRRRSGSSIACVLAAGVAALAISAGAVQRAGVSRTTVLAALRTGSGHAPSCTAHRKDARSHS